MRVGSITADRCVLCGERIARLCDVVAPAARPWCLPGFKAGQPAHRDCANDAVNELGQSQEGARE